MTTDPTWMVNQIGGLVESIAEFGAGGVGIAKAAGAGIKGLSTAGQAMNLSSKMTRVGAALGAKGKYLPGMIARQSNLGAQTLTAASLAYVEGAMSGAAVYDEVMKKMIDQGKSPEEAQTRARKAAASTVQMNTTINTLLNFGAVSPFFTKNGKYVDMLGDDAYDAMKRAANKGGQQGIDDIAKMGFTPENAWKAIGIESGKEAIEEVVNVISEHAGKEYGKMSDEQYADRMVDGLAGYFLQFDEFGKSISSAMSAEGALSAVLGAVGGAGQHGIIANIPMHKSAVREFNEETGEYDYVRDDQGEIKYERKSANQQQKEEKEMAFKQAQHNIIADLKYIKERNDSLKQVVAEKKPG
jgi:hypothetical protein